VQVAEAFMVEPAIGNLILAYPTLAHMCGRCSKAASGSCRVQVAEAFMVEPATGKPYALAAAPYDGVEAVWNARNFWACLQMPAPHSDARARPADLATDLGDTGAWEALWEEAPAPVRAPPEAGGGRQDGRDRAAAHASWWTLVGMQARLTACMPQRTRVRRAASACADSGAPGRAAAGRRARPARPGPTRRAR